MSGTSSERGSGAQATPRGAQPRTHRVRLGERCLNSCAHCKYRRDVASTRATVDALSPLHETLPSGIRSGDTVLFHGPEPAAQPGFGRAVREARAAGAHIALYTTARPFAAPAGVQGALRLGVRSFVVPWFGSEAARFDAVAGEPGSFAASLAGLRNLGALPGVELRVDVLVVPRAADDVSAALAVVREAAPAAEIRLVHLLPLGGAAALPDWFEADTAAVTAAIAPLLRADGGLRVTHFDDRVYPWVSGRGADALDRDERFRRLEQADAACEGPLCDHCAHQVVCAYFQRRRAKGFTTYNLTVEAPCGLACGFCQRRFTDLAGREEPYDAIVERFQRDAVSQRVGRVRINGADPLEHPRLLDILAVVAEAGVRELELFTPGLRLAEPAFAEALFAALEPFDAVVLPPIYGADAETHDTIMGAPGAFERLRKAMDVLRPYSDRVRFTSLVLRANYRVLGDIWDLVSGAGFAMEPARFVRPFSDDPEDYARVAPRMRDVVEFHAELGRPDVRRYLGLFGFPPCTYWDLFPAPESLADIQVDAGSYDVTKILRSHDQFRLKRDQVARCAHESCAAWSGCLNQVQYYRVHGDAEFRPLDQDGSPK